jgi:FMN phosphatase YigB (HAD superfamily)
MASSYDAFLVDLDGTLYAPLPVKMLMAVELGVFGLRHAKKLKVFRHHHEGLRAAQANSPHLEFAPSPFHEQLRRAAEDLAHPEEHLAALVDDWMISRPGKWLRLARRSTLIAEIEAFRLSGGKTALVSDYPAEKKLKALGCESLFDVVVSNGEHPRLTRLKPSPDGFLLAASELSIEPRRCLVLGDRPDADGAAAKAAGMDYRKI